MSRKAARRPVVRVSFAGLALGLLAGAACASAGAEDSRQEVLISAAASLTDVVTALEGPFESAHAGLDLVLNPGGSSSLAYQILEGAPIDVFASADHDAMDRVVTAGLAQEEPRVFARNTLQVAVPAGNPAGVAGLGDLARPGLLVGLCAETVPCGAAARRMLANAGLVVAPDTNEPDVRSLRSKLEAGELDAGIVYLTDVFDSEALEAIPIAPEVNVEVEYPAVVSTTGNNPGGGAALVEFLFSDRGRDIIAGHGFTLP